MNVRLHPGTVFICVVHKVSYSWRYLNWSRNSRIRLVILIAVECFNIGEYFEYLSEIFMTQGMKRENFQRLKFRSFDSLRDQVVENIVFSGK